MTVILKISFGCETEIWDGERQLLFGQDCFHFCKGEAVEFSFLTLAVGIFGRVESTFRVGHVAQEVAQNIPHHGMVLRISANKTSIQIEVNQLGIVIQHFFEMGDQPPFIHGVAGEPAPELIIHPARSHPAAGEEHLLHPLFVVRIHPCHQEQTGNFWLGKLRLAAEPTVFGIEIS